MADQHSRGSLDVGLPVAAEQEATDRRLLERALQRDPRVIIVRGAS
jgi:hypothetical protein